MTGLCSLLITPQQDESADGLPNTGVLAPQAPAIAMLHDTLCWSRDPELLRCGFPEWGGMEQNEPRSLLALLQQNHPQSHTKAALFVLQPEITRLFVIIGKQPVQNNV